MNEQNNNDSQLNGQNLNTNNSTQTSNVVFTEALFNDDVINSVGSSTSNSVISWGVGKKNNQEENNNDNQIESLDMNVEQLLNQVNGTVSTPVEVLDDFYVDNDDSLSSVVIDTLDSNEISQNNQSLNQNMMMNQMQSQDNVSNYNTQNNIYVEPASGSQIQPTVQPVPKPQIQPVVQPVPKPQIQPVVQPVPQNQNVNNAMQPVNWSEGLGVPLPVEQTILNQQPLSAPSLGVQSLNEAEKPKDVLPDSKFFSSNKGQEIQQINPNNIELKYGNGQINIDEMNRLDGINDTTLVKQYVGMDFTKINMAPFSFSAFILGGFYLMYRKIYFVGILVVITELFMLNFLELKIALIAFFVFRIALSLIVNPLYIKIVKERVKNIKNKKQNRKKNQVEFNTLCGKKGGTNFFLALLLYILCFSSVFFVAIKYLPAGNFNKYIDLALEYINGKPYGVYEGKIKTKDLDVESYMNIVVPKGFIKSSGTAFNYSMITNGSGLLNECNLSISEIDGFNNGEEFIRQYAEYEKIDSEINKTESNGITWYTLTTEDDMGTHHFRTTTIDNKAILFKYDNGKDSEYGVCDVNLVEILTSMSKKEK